MRRMDEKPVLMVNLPLATITFAVNHGVRDETLGHFAYYTETNLEHN